VAVVVIAPCGCSLIKVKAGLCDSYGPADVPALERGEFPPSRDELPTAPMSTLRELLRCPACRQHFDEQICLAADDLSMVLSEDQIAAAKHLLQKHHAKHG